VAWSEEEGFQDEEVEGSLEEGDAVVVAGLGRHSTQLCSFLGSDVNMKRILFKSGTQYPF
jgi:hypothetical protein